jgi:hypothetical protein
MAKSLTDTVRENAEGPAEASGDGQSMRQHNLRDQVAADRYLSSRDATRRRKRGLNIAKFSPPGAI